MSWLGWLFVTLAMCHMSCHSMLIEEVALDPGSTTWYPVPPSIATNNKILRKYIGRIAHRLSGVTRPVGREITKKTSPSLDLLWDDLGNKRYLNHSTLKHSIEELAALSSSDDEGHVTPTDCGAIVDGPKVFFHTCPGDLIVVTIAGSMKMTCLEIEKRVFYGPVLLKNLVCQQSMIFDMDCETRLKKQLTKTECDVGIKKTTIIVESVLIVVILLLFYASMAWVCGMHRGLDLRDEKIPFTRNGWKITADYDEYVDDNGEVCQKKHDGVSEVNMARKQFKIPFLKLLILFLLCRPIRVTSYEVASTYDTTLAKYAYKVILGDSEEVVLGPSVLRRDVVAYSSQLTKLFTTASWSLSHKEEYYCQWYKCEAMSVCGMGALPFAPIGTLAQVVFNYSNPDRAFFTCQKLQGYCTFGNGCKLLSFQVDYRVDDLFDVYAIGQGGQHGGDITPPIGCVVDQIIDESSGQMNSQLMIRKMTGETYLCPREYLSMKPELGMIGDLQILSDKKTLFATNEIHCVADHSDRSICRYQKSTMESISSLCTRLEDLPFKVDVDVNMNYLSWVLQGQATVSLKCDRPLSFKTGAHLCSNITMRVWEVAHLDASLLLSFQADSGAPGASFRLPKIVHAMSKLFPCDGKVHYTTLYDLKSLNSSGLDFTHELIPYKGIDTMQQDHFSNEDPTDDSNLGFLAGVKDWFPSMSMSLALIIMLAVSVCCCIGRR